MAAIKAFPKDVGDFNKARKWLHLDDHQACICFAALGEAINALYDDEKGLSRRQIDEATDRIHKLIHDGDLQVVGFGTIETHYEDVVQELREDNRMYPTDAAIIASACVDGLCDTLATTDKYRLWTNVQETTKEYDVSMKGIEKDD